MLCVAGSASPRFTNDAVSTNLLIDLDANLLVTRSAQSRLAGLKRLVAGIALVFEIGMRAEIRQDQPRLGAGSHRARVESRTASPPGENTQPKEEHQGDGNADGRKNR